MDAEGLAQLVLTICLGLGSCGFRVFVPCLMVGMLQRLGVDSLQVMPAWMGSTVAITVLGAATAIEVGAYYFPWLDNLLDTVTSPLSVVAGMLLFVGVTDELPPIWRWGLGIIAGGGAAGVAQGATVMTRIVSTATTGGLGNFIVSTVEWFGAVAIVLCVVAWAPLALLLVVALVWSLVRVQTGRKQPA
jgi:hypothetical protein